MIRNSELLEALEREQLRARKPDYEENLAIFEALHEEARFFGVLPPRDPLEGIEVDIRPARAPNFGSPPSRICSSTR